VARLVGFRHQSVHAWPDITKIGAALRARRHLVAATGIERGETGYPGAATSGIVKDPPGFIQAIRPK